MFATAHSKTTDQRMLYDWNEANDSNEAISRQLCYSAAALFFFESSFKLQGLVANVP
jgi:hypothetical protein